MQVPIKVGGEVFGVFSADFVKPHHITPEELNRLILLAQRAALAIKNAQIFEQTHEIAITEERNRLARELHDAVTQSLFSASLIAEALPSVLESNPVEGQELLTELRQLNRGALAEMRTLLMELRPSALIESHLEDLLRQLAEAATGREGIPITVTTNGYSELPPDVHIALYRMAQEALNNALKHARATEISIILKKVGGTSSIPYAPQSEVIELYVNDNGRGFNPEHISSDHLGLNIMRERAASIGAEVNIQSQNGNGTSVQIVWKEDNHD